MYNQHERRQLERIEQQFEADDPRLAQALRQHQGTSRAQRIAQLAASGLGAVLIVFGALSFSLAMMLMGAAMAGWALWTHLGERGMGGTPDDATARPYPADTDTDWGEPPAGGAGAR